MKSKKHKSRSLSDYFDGQETPPQPTPQPDNEDKYLNKQTEWKSKFPNGQ